MAQVANIASAIVFVALISVLVTSKNTAPVLTALGGIFTNSLSVAKG